MEYICMRKLRSALKGSVNPLDMNNKGCPPSTIRRFPHSLTLDEKQQNRRQQQQQQEKEERIRG